MDTPPKLPSSSTHRRRRQQQGIDVAAVTTNKSPERGQDESEEERLTPPLEIFVREMSFNGLGGDQSSSALTEVTFGDSCSWTHPPQDKHTSGANQSTTSSVSSQFEEDHNALINAASGDEEENRQSFRRLPARGQSSRRPRTRRGGKKGIMRWASMPHKKECQKSPGAAHCPPSCGCDQRGGVQPSLRQSQSPRLPRRQGSEASLDDSSETNIIANKQNNETENRPDSSEHQHDHTTSGSGSRDGASRNRERPRLPTRKKSASNGSLFGGSMASTTSSTGTEELILSAYAA